MVPFSIVSPQPYRQIPECSESRFSVSSKDEKAFNGSFTIKCFRRFWYWKHCYRWAKAVTGRLVDFDGFEPFDRAAKRRKNMRLLGLRLARPPQHTTAIQIKVVQDMWCMCYAMSRKSRCHFSFHRVRNNYYSKEKWSRFNSKSFLTVKILLT